MELRKSGMEETWQVFGLELDLMVRFQCSLVCCSLSSVRPTGPSLGLREVFLVLTITLISFLS